MLSFVLRKYELQLHHFAELSLPAAFEAWINRPLEVEHISEEVAKILEK